MPPKKEKKEKQVNFASDVQTEIVAVDPAVAAVSRFVKNAYGSVWDHTKDSSRREAARQIYREFTMYLDQLDQQDFPRLKFDENNATRVTYSDPRITTYCVLMKALRTNDASLFRSSYQNNEIKFSVSGSPVAPENNSFAQWGIFTRAAVVALQKAIPEADLTAWSVPEPSKVMNNSNVQEQQESSTDASLLVDELVSRQEQPESTSEGFVSPIPHAEPSPQSVPLQLDNYDFNAWQAPVELAGLLASLKAMHAYGLLLKSTGSEKANAAMQLAIELTNDLKDYYTASPEEQNKGAFVAEFHNKLHSQDQLMSPHRQYWKVVLANIAVALTCVGLLAVGVSLLVRGHGFFNVTHSQNNVNDVEQQFDKSLRVT
ncbi:MAG: hypothetical protein P4L79_16840 [Legionella sp.]|uniref:hypothetical protein n=1 Tax=Legionella sp. TaxID=459 RepID=UPI00283D92B6|nr:hypothetical protein [Legionella sp.]